MAAAIASETGRKILCPIQLPDVKTLDPNRNNFPFKRTQQSTYKKWSLSLLQKLIFVYDVLIIKILIFTSLCVFQLLFKFNII